MGVREHEGTLTARLTDPNFKKLSPKGPWVWVKTLKKRAFTGGDLHYQTTPV